MSANKKTPQPKSAAPHIRAFFSFHHSLIKRVYWGRIVMVLVGICLVSVGYQLSLPSNLSTSRARAGNIDLVSMTPEQISEVLTSVEQSSYIYLRIGSEQYIKKYTDLGITIDIAAVQQIAEYSLQDKLIPFSAVTRYASDTAQDITYNYNPEVARKVIDEIAAFEYVEPESSELEVDGLRVAVVPHVVGGTVDIEQSVQSLANLEYQDRLEVALNLNEVQPDILSSQVLPLAEEANRYIQEAPIIQTPEKDVVVPAGVMVNWFYMDITGESPVLGISDEAVGEYLDQLANDLQLPSSTTEITLHDGHEVSRKEGSTGRVLDRDALLAGIKSNLSKTGERKPIAVGFKKVTPRVVYKNTYSESSGGLSALLGDIARRHGDYKISVIGLDKQVSASYKGDTVTVAASTYKVFVAYYVYNQIETGQVQWSDKLPSGRQLDHCMDQMIVISSNSCAQELRDRFGAGNINAKLRTIGLPNAGFGSSYAQTSANELTRFLTMVDRGQIVNATHREHLLGMMKRQIHRSAIPRGVSPAVVADKGGFVWSYNNDTGIVYGDNGRYAVTILAKNESKSGLAAVAKEIHAYMEAL